MPTIHIYAYERSIEKQRSLTRDITDAVCSNYDVDPSIVTPKDKTAHGGVLASDEESSN